MRKLSFFIIALVALVSSSCDILDKATDVDFDVKLNQTFTVAETAVSASGKDYSATQVLDASTNADISKYKSKLKSFTVTKVTYTITDYSVAAGTAAVNFTNGKFSFGASGVTPTVIATLPAINLQTANGGAEAELSVDQAGLTKIGELLLADQKVSIKAEGRLSSTPVSFKINTIVYVTVKANPL